MKIYQKYKMLPLGAIKAEGFLKDQMLLGKDGMAGHLYELEPQMIADPYINKTFVEAWGNGDQSGWGAEISGNYWSGYIEYAFTLDNPEMIEIATGWVDAMMKKQREDGYLGTFYEEDANIYDDYNAMGTACAMRGLIAFYEATGRQDVLEAVHRCMLWFCDKWAGDHKTAYAGQGIIETMILTYWNTGDTRLVKFSEDYLKFLCDHDIFNMSYKSMLEGDYHYFSNHTVGVGHHVMHPALVYTATGKEEYLEATVRRLDQVRAKSVHLSGSPVSVAEYLGPVGSVTETEYCNYAVFNTTYSFLSCITGETRYGDYMEEMFYNGAQGARKKDEKAIAYLNAPNQIYATSHSSFGAGDVQVYAPVYPTSCCAVNSVRVVPEFIRGMIVADEYDNMYVMAYGPCSLKYKGIELEEKTYYPFRNQVSFEIKAEKDFALNLKIPEWCKSYTVKVNGTMQQVIEEENFVKLHKSWKYGDVIEISFNAEVKVCAVDDSDASSKYPLAIKYGVLLFTYHIPEEWKPVKGRPLTPLPEGWNWFDVMPVYQEADVADAHEQIGLRRNQFSWNVALDEKLSAEDIQVEELPENGYVWTNPMIRLHTYCYKAPFLCAPYQEKTLEPNCKYQYVTDKLPLVLEPYGCTNLRITYFPRADLTNKKGSLES